MAYRSPPRFCIGCGVDGDTGVKISYRGKCQECGVNRQVEAIEQMAAKRGPIARKWLTSIQRAGERAIAEAIAEDEAKAARWEAFLEQERNRNGPKHV